MTTTLLSCLECLDRLNDKIMSVGKEIQEIRTCITELLSSVQSEAAVMDSGTIDGTTYLQTIFDDEPNTRLATLSGLPQPDQEYGPLESVEVIESLPEDTDAMICQYSPGKLVIFSA
ncbi:hypothetical protein BDR07DRAFT_1405180 [Suillus spraguei]|nr:hypothetical protein BDR07DRAFT_1405180 [Suillus spraguei]